MQTICRLIQLSVDEATSLVKDPGTLANHVRSATTYSDVYRYWHGIEYLLAQHLPGSAAAKYLQMGASVAPASANIPSARVLSAAQVQEIDADLRQIQPEDLISHYD